MGSGVLKREVDLIGAVAYGVGIIVGTGVYALIGKAAGHAGNTVWASLVCAYSCWGPWYAPSRTLPY